MHPHIPYRVAVIIGLLIVLLLAGCSSTRSPPASTTAVPDERAEIVLAALGYLDVPYVYGGTDRQGLDCSALVQRVYRRVGRQVPRTSRQQAQTAQRVQHANIQPGDVVFFAIDGGHINHVGIYIGNGRFVHAPNSRSRVRVEPLHTDYWQPRLRFAGHFL